MDQLTVFIFTLLCGVIWDILYVHTFADPVWKGRETFSAFLEEKLTLKV